MFGLFETGFSGFYWGNGVMLVIALVLIYLGIGRKMEPLLLLPIGFGVLLVNLPLGGLMDYGTVHTLVQAPTTGRVVEVEEVELEKRYEVGDYLWRIKSLEGEELVSVPVTGEIKELRVSPGQSVNEGDILAIIEHQVPRGLLSRIFEGGIAMEIIPPLIFLGLGAMTDFGPLIANPKTLLLGAGAQFGVYFSLLLALALGFNINEACSIGIIGGADGPTTIFVTNRLAPHILGATAVAAYSYMALVPIIQPPVIRALTTKKERQIYMKPQLREVSNLEKILFPLVGSIVIIMLVPESAPLIGMFMMGNLLLVSGVTDRLAETAANAFMNILTILLGVSVGAMMAASYFLVPKTIVIFILGVVAFAASTAFGILLAKLMNKVSKEPINPMIGAAGVSAVPMAARVVQRMGQKENPRNFLLMHAMGPNIAGVIGTATAAGVFLGMIG